MRKSRNLLGGELRRQILDACDRVGVRAFAMKEFSESALRHVESVALSPVILSEANDLYVLLIANC